MLKKFFDIYQNFKIPNSKKIESFYVYNSRKLNKQKKENVNYKEYLKSFSDGEYLNIVDSGWNNSSQEYISEYLKINTRGYYIGTFSKNKLNYKCDRNGLIYDIDEEGKVSDFYWSLRINFTLIEQLLAANHGSVDSYDDKIFKFTWVEQEKEYYEKYIKNIQEEMIENFKQICIWSNDSIDNINNKKLARRMVKSGLFANESRIKFLKDSDEAYYDNFSNNEYKGKLKIGKRTLIDKVFFPEKRLSVLVKKQRRLKNNWIIKKLYYVWAIFLYIKLIILKKI